MQLVTRNPISAARRNRQQKISVTGYAGDGKRSGDSYGWAKLSDGKFAVALSDGMGKGEVAHQESSLAVGSVIKLLKAGLDPELVLKLVNMILVLESKKESFPTMDLVIQDPIERVLKIYKIGAAPTIIKRKNKIEILTAPAMPMGVMEYSRIPCVSSIITSGDQIIMMTDGIVDSKRDDLELKWLKKLLSQIKSRDLQTVCDLIMRQAVMNYEHREKDDMTVVSFIVR